MKEADEDQSAIYWIVITSLSSIRYRARPIIKPLGFIGLRKAIDVLRAGHG